MQQYVAQIDIAERIHDAEQTDEVMETLAAFSPSVRDNANGGSTITITVTAPDLAQAARSALDRVAGTGHQVLALTVMTEDEREAREGVIDVPPLVSGAEAAKHLGLTPGAVTAQIREGRLQGVQVGRTWAVPLAAVTAAANAKRRK